MLEYEVPLDQLTGTPTGIIGRLSLAEPSSELRSAGITALDGMFAKANASLEAANLSIWVLLDRLDVAFADSHELEANAIRALVRVYTDLGALDRISLKIFLREDIWKRVTIEGLREASHIVRLELMSWSSPMLLNVAMRRILNNEVLCQEFGINKDEFLAEFSAQEQLFDRLFTKQVEQGIQKTTTFNWMIGRCADGTGNTAPREFIHLLNCLKEEEIRRLELGGTPLPDEQLFDRSVFKAALPTVSNMRLHTYLYAEYKSERPFIEKLEGEKTKQTPESLAGIWGVTREEAIERASDLVALGFFEKRGTKAEPTFWVPFLYRDALNLRQGKADIDDDEAVQTGEPANDPA